MTKIHESFVTNCLFRTPIIKNFRMWVSEPILVRGLVLARTSADQAFKAVSAGFGKRK